MPPVMDERQDIDEVLDIDKQLTGYDTADYVFTDISPSSNDKVYKMCFPYTCKGAGLARAVNTSQIEVQGAGSRERIVIHMTCPPSKFLDLSLPQAWFKMRESLGCKLLEGRQT